MIFTIIFCSSILIVFGYFYNILFIKFRKAKANESNLINENTNIKDSLIVWQHKYFYLVEKEKLITENRNIMTSGQLLPNNTELRGDKKIQRSDMEYEQINQLLISLQIEKETIELEKRKLDEKVKKLWNASTTIHKDRERIASLNKIIDEARKQSDLLLLNILPLEIAEELKKSGASAPRRFEQVTIMFTDFKGFTSLGEQLTPEELVTELHECFCAFDRIIEKYHIEKIKTIGDAYMAVAGLPTPNEKHAENMVCAAIEIRDTIEKRLTKPGIKPFEIRIGINSGTVVAGIVGLKKYAYDIWGDAVNIAARMEQNGTPGKINVSQTTFDLVHNLFDCEYRGEIPAKNRGNLKMYYLEPKSTL